MSSPTFADEILVQHHGDGEPTRYENVRYWLWRDGITVYDETGAEIASHDDVRQVVSSKRHQL